MNTTNSTGAEQQHKASVLQPREITPDEEAEWGSVLDLCGASTLNRARFDPALLIQYLGQWVAWSPDGSRVVAHAHDIRNLRELVAEAGEDPSLCAIEGIEGVAES
jgi:hypothetical protein